jgi:LacI family transcriptional regulator
MAVTMVEIAKRTNLSPATVSRVINGKGVGFISAATRQRVLEVAREMGFEATRLPSDSPSGRTMVVAAWIRHPDRPYYARIIRHLLDAAGDSGYDLIIAPVHDAVAPDAHAAAGVLPSHLHDGPASTWPSDGIIAVDCPAAADAFARRFPPGACPVVGINVEYSPHTDYVALDVGGGVRQAIEHLASVGCRRVAVVSSTRLHDKVRVARTSAYEEAMHAAALGPELILAPEATRGSVRQCVAAYIQSHGSPDALFCLNDDLALGAYRALRDMGVRVPDDCALVACDTTDDADYLDVPFTAIAQPMQEMCRTAWEVLMRRLRDPGAPLSQTLLRPEFRIGPSSRRAATSSRSSPG